MKLFIYEDPGFPDFYPLSVNRPACLLLVGTSQVYRKIMHSAGVDIACLLCRDYVGPYVGYITGLPVNELPVADDEVCLFVNGRLDVSSVGPGILSGLEPGGKLIHDGDVAAFAVTGKDVNENPAAFLALYKADKLAKVAGRLAAVNADCRLFGYLWEIVDRNGAVLVEEISEAAGRRQTSKFPENAAVYGDHPLVIGEDARIAPGTIINCENGPVFIDRGTDISGPCYIEGPCYVGPGCRISRAKIGENCSIGPVCVIGGELEETIILGYTNKAHEGFLGHSYLGEWINLGAMTTNSDLKNNYSPVRMVFPGDDGEIDTGLLKVGAFMGDHSKTAIGTLINTGCNIGFCSNIFGEPLVKEKLVPSFSWGLSGARYDLDRAVSSARAVKSRRNKELSEAEETLFKFLHAMSKTEMSL